MRSYPIRNVLTELFEMNVWFDTMCNQRGGCLFGWAEHRSSSRWSIFATNSVMHAVITKKDTHTQNAVIKKFIRLAHDNFFSHKRFIKHKNKRTRAQNRPLPLHLRQEEQRKSLPIDTPYTTDKTSQQLSYYIYNLWESHIFERPKPFHLSSFFAILLCFILFTMTFASPVTKTPNSKMSGSAIVTPELKKSDSIVSEQAVRFEGVGGKKIVLFVMGTPSDAWSMSIQCTMEVIADHCHFLLPCSFLFTFLLSVAFSLFPIIKEPIGWRMCSTFGWYPSSWWEWYSTCFVWRTFWWWWCAELLRGIGRYTEKCQKTWTDQL